jgi:hypothetical protein
MPAQGNSVCRSCLGVNLKTFNGEMAMHFPGPAGLNKPIVWVFSTVAVCLNCGFSEFVVPARELRVLVEERPVDGAVVSSKKSAAHSANAA